MLTPDLINGLFEFVGGLALSRNIVALYRDKKIRGVSLAPTFFFTSWGFWNLYFYPSLHQWLSFAGGLIPAIVNVIWLTLAVRYRKN
jgi:hypothetical protein